MLQFGAVGNFPATLPARRPLWFGGYKLAAVNGRDGDVFPERDLRAKLQDVETLVSNQPVVSAFRSNCEHDVDCTLDEEAGDYTQNRVVSVMAISQKTKSRESV